MPPDAVIFDLDGTILDTLPDLADSLNSALARRGLQGHPVEAVRLMIGSGAEALIRRALARGGLSGHGGAASGGMDPEPETVESLRLDFKREYAERQLGKTAPYPGVEELLEGLAAMGAKLAVLSNKDHDNSAAIVEHFFPGRFQRVQGAMREIPLKPDPAGAEMILSALSAAPERTLYVGDSAVDMLTAKAAGLVPLGAAWGFRSAEELATAGAAAVFERPIGILPFALAWTPPAIGIRP